MKSRISVESGSTREDPAVRLRERLKKISEIKQSEAAKQENEETTEFKNEIVLNDVDEFCRAVSQANEEKKFIAERTQVEREREEAAEKIKKEKEMDVDVEEEYKKLKAQRMRERGLKVKVNHFTTFIIFYFFL